MKMAFTKREKSTAILELACSLKQGGRGGSISIFLFHKEMNRTSTYRTAQISELTFLWAINHQTKGMCYFLLTGFKETVMIHYHFVINAHSRI